MTDEPTDSETSESGPVDLNDPRFEVKWRKKSTASPTPVPPSLDPDHPEAFGSAGAVDVAALQKELEKERERAKDLHDRWQRAAADLANLRRRTEGEREEVEQFASMRLVQELLPVLDNFERAIATIPGNLGMLTWIQGVMLIQRHLEALLEQRGLAPIKAQGEAFNPHYHEAVNEREQEGIAPGTVIQEYQRGYSMHGRVIRPTLVVIAKEPEPQAAPVQPEAAAEPLATDTSEAQHILVEAEADNPGP